MICERCKKQPAVYCAAGQDLCSECFAAFKHATSWSAHDEAGGGQEDDDDSAVDRRAI